MLCYHTKYGVSHSQLAKSSEVQLGDFSSHILVKIYVSVCVQKVFYLSLMLQIVSNI